MGDISFHFAGPVVYNSPDMNPVYYRICGEMQQRLYQTKVRDMDELKQRRLSYAWLGAKRDQ